MAIFVKNTFINSGFQMPQPFIMTTRATGSANYVLQVNNVAGNAIVQIGQSDINDGRINLNTSGGTQSITLRCGTVSSLNNINGLILGGSTENTKAILKIVSTTRGLLFPVMTTAQKNAIGNEAGLVVFDSSLSKLCVNSGAGWETITSV